MRAEIFWIDPAPVGRLAIMPRPRGGDWLLDEIQSWKSSGVDIVVSLLCDDEIVELGLEQKPSLCEELGISFISYGIADRGVPDSRDSFLAMVENLYSDLQKGRGIGIHCRMGIGRSSLLAACLLVKSGLAPVEAFTLISHCRGFEVPDTSVQMRWIELV